MLLHGLVAIVLIGSTTHNGWLAILALRGRRPLLRRIKLYCRVSWVAYLLTFTFGLLIYPVFRAAVRTHFDADLPLATGFFELKEHWSAIGLALVAYQRMSLAELTDGSANRRFFMWSVVCVMSIVWGSLLVGATLAALEPV